MEIPTFPPAHPCLAMMKKLKDLAYEKRKFWIFFVKVLKSQLYVHIILESLRISYGSSEVGMTHALKVIPSQIFNVERQ